MSPTILIWMRSAISARPMVCQAGKKTLVGVTEEGVYIGPGSEFRPPIIEQPEGEWETPTEVEATAEDEATPSEGTATPAA